VSAASEPVAIRRIVEPFFAGLGFLTRVPLPSWVRHEDGLLARSTVYFPVVGALVGALGGGVLLLASELWTPLVAAALSTVATVMLTGALHEDALADACDGFGAGRTREQVLEIMRDSRIGTYGAVGLLLTLGTKLGALAAMSSEEAVRALVAGHVLGRWSSLPLMRALPYAREAGAGRPFIGSITSGHLAIGSVLAAGLTAAALGRVAIAAWVAAALLTWLVARYFRSRIGGVTGDCLGATNQMVEVVTYLVVLA
jgi:adenosylcobinamide-GDP ribazoletransferase